MKVILLKDVPKIGRKNEIVNVSDGYALNYLIPKKLAEKGTENKISQLEKRKEQQKEKERLNNELITKELESVQDVEVSITEKANEQGGLFKAVKPEKITEALAQAGYKNIGVENILPEKPPKETGKFTIKVQAADKTAEFVLNIEAA